MTGSSPGFCLHINLIVSQVPYYKGELITFDVVPENLPFLVGHGLVRLSPDFQVAGFSVTGQVLDSVKVGFEYCQFTIICGERGGSVVECRTLEREVEGSIPTAAVWCP